jgi:hypothetical protein
VITRSVDHQYTYEGQTYPGVTSILRVIDKSDALMRWASRKTAEAALGLLEELPNMLGQVGTEGVLKALSSRSAWQRDEAAGVGTEIHAMADLVAHGQALPEMLPSIRTRVDHYLAWWNASGWTLRASEALLVNPLLGYGGTLDLLAYDRDGKTVLADVKTGSGVYREVILQLAAYGASELIQVDGVVYPMPKVDRYAVLHVTLEGVREVEVNVGGREREAFMAAMDLSEWRESVKGRL